MKSILAIRNILIAIPVILLIAGLHYALPQVDVVRAVGVEIKRVDAGSSADTARTRDVYYLQMETLDGDPKVYRNEDNFLYGKFDSADLQTQIQSFASDKQIVALRHYGWRLNLFSSFPNGIKAWPVEEGYRHIPVFNIVVLLGIAIVAFLIYRRITSALKKSREVAEAKKAERAERQAMEEREVQETAEHRRKAALKQDDDVEAFLNSGGDKKN